MPASDMYNLDHVQSAAGEFVLRIEACRLERGGVYAVSGPNGCGKTTLLDLLALLGRPRAGALTFDGEAVHYDDPAELLRRRRRIGYLMQNPYLFNMSVLDNVAYGLTVRGARKPAARTRARAVMERLSLLPLAHRNAHLLSGGEAQRVALARTLVLGADVLLLDEPTANVDRRHVRTVEELILAANRERGSTVVLTTHSRDQAYRMSPNQIAIIDGEIRDVAYENVFAGALRTSPDGVGLLDLGSGVSIRLAHHRAGEVTVAIDPQDILVSREPLASSALNRLSGSISRVEEAGGSLRIFVDAGLPFCALVTRRSYGDMGLNVGHPVWITFKANAVRVL